MAQLGSEYEITSGSDNSLIRSATNYRPSTSDESLRRNSHIYESRSSEEGKEYNDSDTSSIESDLHTPPLTISGRGALISGMAVPNMDSDEEVEFEGNDVESGPKAPDSDFAKYVPPNVFHRAQLPPKNETNLRTIAVHSHMKRRSITESSDAPEHINIEYSSAASDKPFRSKRLWCILTLISCMVVGAVITVAVVLSRKDDLSAQQQEISDITISISGKDSIDNINSPQGKAHMWIVHDDKLFRNTNELLNRDVIVQRFVLAVFYYATNGQIWAENNWLSGGSACSDAWTGIKCNTQNQVISLLFERQGLSGSIPAEIGHLSNIENFVLNYEEGLVGNLPSTFGKLSALRQLSLSHNKLEGTIPTELYLATTLSYINFEENGMSGSISTDIGKLTELRTLILANNTFDGPIPYDELSNSPIEYLGLSSNTFSGSVSQSIQSMTSLRYLYLDRNEQISGEIPVSIGGATSLISINFDFTGISGRIPAILGRLRQLEYLSMQGNQLYGSIPGEINLLHKLKTFNLVGNMLTGELPDLSALTNLKSLLLVGNKFSGTITDQLTNLRSIEYLFLSSNQFTGPIPTNIGRPEGFTGSLLKGLYISENKFDGSIPESICQYNQLGALFIDDNQLTGPIPSCIGNLVDLRQFYAFKNLLTGTVPIEISTLRELRGLGLENNELGGEVSNEICELVSSVSDGFDFWTDCGGAQPEISCPCCSVCCPSEQCV